MGKSILDPTFWAVVGAIWNAILAVWSFLKTLWDFINPVWGIISNLWGAIKGIWDYLRPLVSNVYTAYIKPIKDLLTSLWSKFDSLIDWVDDIYKNTIGRIEKVYDLLFGKYEKLWGDFVTFRDKIVRLVDKIDPDLAAKIYRETERIEGQTLGQIRNVRDELTSKVNEYYHAVRDYVNERYQALKDLVDPYISKTVEIERHLKISWDKPGQLSRDSYVNSNEVHGQALYEKFFGERTFGVNTKFIGELKERPLTFIDVLIQDMNSKDPTPWDDVKEYIDKTVYWVENDEEPGDFVLNEDLLTQTDREDYLKAKEDLDRPFLEIVRDASERFDRWWKNLMRVE